MDQKTIDIIKSTVPVLEEHGEKITTVFYKRMFEDHPELLNIFNHANQKQGRQQRALASTVYAAAQYIDNLGAILPAVRVIAHKHRSLGIKPDQYPIVGKYLLIAIKEVLGVTASDDVIEAWAKAYGMIADAFIGVEAEMYQEAGWEGFKNFIVARKEKESEHITSFYLKPEDGSKPAPFVAGQYISIMLEMENETFTHIRQYSLSAAPGRDHYRITVKKENSNSNPDGVVSNYLHDKIEEGMILKLSAPAGDFVIDLKGSNPVVLISGGVGLTPMVSMLQAVVEAQPERKVSFIHAASNGQLHALADEVRAYAAKGNVSNYVFYDSPNEDDREAGRFDEEGFVTKEWLEEHVHLTDSDVYFCGPVPFMKSIHSSLRELGVPHANIHFEYFGPMEQF
ncbi:NO-inducible flavohemoprotein [Mesobacillus zeae]